MIPEGSCDNEHMSNDAENSLFENNLTKLPFLLYFYQINATLFRI